MKQKALKIIFGLTVLLFCISAISPVLIPFAIDENGMMNVMGYLSGGMFWFGLLSGGVLYIVLMIKAKPRRRGRRGKKQLPAIFRFFSNTVAKITDSLLIIGLCGTVYCSTGRVDSQIVVVIFLVLLLIGIYTHFLFNGKVYQYICNSKEKTSKVITK